MRPEVGTHEWHERLQAKQAGLTHAFHSALQDEQIREMAVEGYFCVDDGEPEPNPNYDENEDEDQDCGWP